jgi:hypothetical protein
VQRRALGVALLGIAIAFPAAAEPWKRFAPPGGGFSIEMPGEPRSERGDHFTPVGSVVETKYWLAVEGAELSVETHDIPTLAAAMMSDAMLLDQARDGVIENEGGTAITSHELEFEGAPARAFTYRYPGEPLRLERVLTVLVGARIYLLTGTGADPSAHPAVARFFDSFTFAAQLDGDAGPEAEER